MYRFWYNFQWMIKLYIIFCLNFLNFLNLFLLTFLWTTFCHCFLEKKPYLLICPLVCLVYSVIVYCHSRYNCGFSNPDITPSVKVNKFLWSRFFRFLVGLGPKRCKGPWPIKNLKKQGQKNFFTLTEGVISGLEKPQLDRDGQYTMPDKFFFIAPPVLLYDLAVHFSILLFTFIPPISTH